MMKKLIFAICIITLLGVTLSGNAIAQENKSSTETPQSNVIKIDGFVTVSDYQFIDNQIKITFSVDRSSRIKISDAFAIAKATGASEIPAKTLTLDQGKNTVQMEVSTYKGIQGVAIATANGQIGITKQSGGGPILEGNSPNTFLIYSSIVGAISGISLVGIVVWGRRTKLSRNIERIL